MKYITIGKLSKATGVNIETIRYYERIGLVPAPPRSAGGHRTYEPDHVTRLFFVRRCRALGFSLEAIRALIGLNDAPRSCDEVKSIAMQQVSDIRLKIKDLKRMEKTLLETSKNCRGGDTPDCPILQSLKTPSDAVEGLV